MLMWNIFHRIPFVLISLVFILFCDSVKEKAQIAPQKTILLKKIDYSRLKKNIQTKQQYLNRLYLQARSNAEKKQIIEQAKAYLFSVFTDSLLPAWYGTRWDFNGMTRTPGQGAIACGSFVVFILQDLGFKIPSRMLRQPAENIIKNLCSKRAIHHFSARISLPKIEQWFLQRGTGIYIVGLDIHVGFVIVKDNKVTFCHSSYFNPPLQVVNEPLLTDNPFTRSRYKVVGRILTDDMVEKWIIGRPFEVRYDYER